MKYLILASIAVAASLSFTPAVAAPYNSKLDAKACMKDASMAKAHRRHRAAHRWDAVEVCDCVALTRPYILALHGLPPFPKSTDWFMR